MMQLTRAECELYVEAGFALLWFVQLMDMCSNLKCDLSDLTDVVI